MDKPNALARPHLKPATPAPHSGQVPAQQQPAAAPVKVGDIVNGKYLIEAVIGEGGVGIVIRAQNLELDERVALKFLRPEMLPHKEIVARFAREAKAASSIRSEYVAMVFDVGMMGNGTPYLVMEHLDGKDLSTVLQERGRLGPREAAEYAMQVCEALAVAHAKGVIHRDIKPDNLFVTTRSGMNLIKVLDFGISKTALTGSMFGSDLPVVKTVSLMGTPLYMSPEQVRSSQTVDERTDIWALGMVLYEALAGCSPFRATSITELCAEILEKPIPSITLQRNDLPPGLVHVLEKCLQKDPEHRYQNVAQLAMALMPYAPRRARLCVERAAQALMAAGIIEESTIQLTSTYPPANSSEPEISSASGSFEIGAPKTPSVPNAPGMLVAPPSPASWSTTSEVPVATAASGAVPAAAASAHELGGSSPSLVSRSIPDAPASTDLRSTRTAAIVAGVAALAAVAAVLAWVRVASSGGPVAAAQASTPAVVQVTRAGTPAAGVAAPAVSVTSAVTGADPTPAAAPAKADPGAAARAVTTAAAKPTPTAFKWAPAAPAKAATTKPAKRSNSEEPDLGY
jgi:serine/threonine-protein kinase